MYGTASDPACHTRLLIGMKFSAENWLRHYRQANDTNAYCGTKVDN
jgi:hypothetical protein